MSLRSMYCGAGAVFWSRVVADLSCMGRGRHTGHVVETVHGCRSACLGLGSSIQTSSSNGAVGKCFFFFIDDILKGIISEVLNHLLFYRRRMLCSTLEWTGICWWAVTKWQVAAYGADAVVSMRCVFYVQVVWQVQKTSFHLLIQDIGVLHRGEGIF